MAATDGGRQRRRVVIACQGGGSHTAFTAGVLKRLLGAKEFAGYQVSGLSGTSGGAVCALLAWYALLDDDPVGAGRLLDRFWADNSARGPVEMLVNNWIQWAGAWQDLGVALPAVSPYRWSASVMDADQFCQMLGRQVDFGRIQVDSAGKHPVLLMGAVDVLSGRFRTFNRVSARSAPGSQPGLRRGLSCPPRSTCRELGYLRRQPHIRHDAPAWTGRRTPAGRSVPASSAPMAAGTTRPGIVAILVPRGAGVAWGD